ncbi:MAG: hypothetical protein HY858_08415 [Candidatus Solibacter usitatus]|nr:hypothetical protein [Candidatus Solibacter usitatus]
MAAALAVPALAGDRAERVKWDTDKYLSRGEESGPPRSAMAVRGARSKIVPGRSVEADAANPAMAPGVTQVNLFDTGREAYFVVTETLPKGSWIQAFIILADKTELALESRSVDEDLPPGFTLYLTGIKTLGDFWKRGRTTYEVDVKLPDGRVTMSATDFATKGYFRNFADTAFFVPGINSTREFIAGDGSTIVELKGRFLAGKKTYVVFEDIVAPQTAITVVDQDTIQVNLSQVPNLDVTLMKSYLLTVGQDGWTDTVQFRHTPLQ